MVNKSYVDQYNDHRWQKKRLEIIERENYICQYCHSQGNELRVHHTYYDKNKKVWEYDNDTLLCLCQRCHSDLHEFLENINRLVSFCRPQNYEPVIFLINLYFTKPKLFSEILNVR